MMTTQVSIVNEYILLCGFVPVTPTTCASYHVTCIVDATNIPRTSAKAKEIPDIEYMHIPVDDSDTANLERYFEEASDLIEKHRLANGRVIVHCAAGISRSTTLVLAYLMKYQKMPLRDAYYFVREKRPSICPNNGFWKQLVKYEMEIFGENTVKMIRGRYTAQIPDIWLSRKYTKRT